MVQCRQSSRSYLTSDCLWFRTPRCNTLLASLCSLNGTVNHFSILSQGMRLRGGHVEGAERIARHYKFSLSTVFDRYKDAQAVIVIEDDLLFSPDFYEYFQYVSPILQEDKSVFAVSAWNDNGFKRRVKVRTVCPSIP